MPASRRLTLALLSLGLMAPLAGRAAPKPSAARWQQWPLRPLPPGPDAGLAEDDFADLAPLGQGLTGVRVLALGEQTHGTHEEFAYKLRLLRYLHEQQGFDLLLLESGFLDTGLLAQDLAAGRGLVAQAPGNIFFMYSKSAEGRALLRYLEQRQRSERPLLLAGIDSQHSGALSQARMAPGLAQALADAGRPELAQGPGWARVQALLPDLLALSRQAPQAAEQREFLAHVQAMQGALLAASTPATMAPQGPHWWAQVAMSLEAQARNLWSDGRENPRDNAMGANAIWLMERLYPGRKAVVWAHTIHVARGLQRSPQHLQAGEVMHRHWGPTYQVLNFSTAAGRYLEFTSGQAQPVPRPASGSLEAGLAGRPGVRLLRAAAPLPQAQFGWEYQTAAPAGQPETGRLGQHWDWTIFLPRVSPVRMVL